MLLISNPLLKPFAPPSGCVEEVLDHVQVHRIEPQQLALGFRVQGFRKKLIGLGLRFDVEELNTVGYHTLLWRYVINPMTSLL